MFKPPDFENMRMREKGKQNEKVIYILEIPIPLLFANMVILMRKKLKFIESIYSKEADSNV